MPWGRCEDLGCQAAAGEAVGGVRPTRQANENAGGGKPMLSAADSFTETASLHIDSPLFPETQPYSGVAINRPLKKPPE